MLKINHNLDSPSVGAYSRNLAVVAVPLFPHRQRDEEYKMKGMEQRDKKRCNKTINVMVCR